MYLILSLGFIAFLFSLLLTPLVRDVFRKLGVVDLPDGIRKHHTEPVPRVGGIAIALSYLASFGVVLFLPFTYRANVEKALPDVGMLLLAAGVVFGVGLWDDLRGLKPWQKLGGQLVAAVIAYAGGVQIHIDSANALDPYLSIPLTIVWLLGCTNAFNLIDGLDGLAAGVGFFATLTMLLAALTQNSIDLILVTMPLAGSLLAFLRYNFNPASIFLGDCGSLLIGFLLGCFGTIWSQKSVTILGMLAPLMAMSIPLLDAGLAIIRRFLRHQPIFGADRGHIHHRLLDRGLTPRQVALILYGFCGLVAIFSLLQNVVKNQFGGLIVVLFCMAAWLGIQHLGYAEFGMARQILFQGTMRRLIDSQTRLRDFEVTLKSAGSQEEKWSIIRKASRDFGFLSVRMSLDGLVREEQTNAQREESNACWQLRITLPHANYINFTRESTEDVHPMVLGGFVKVVERGLKTEAAGEPAMGEPAIYVAGAAGSGVSRAGAGQ
jgi:UDP-GlcNAc:undecaprenyl-phosphate GlcNAc-1-phosphate transferase